MIRLFKSSNFWNALIGSGVVITVYLFTKSEFLAIGVFGLFGVRSVATGLQDAMKERRGSIGGGGIRIDRTDRDED